MFVRADSPVPGVQLDDRPSADIVRRALARAGIEAPLKGAHLLRRSLACGMLKNGASLEEIGQILRHRHPETTQIYAKVDPRGVAHAGAGVAGRCVVIDLRTLLDEYLATRRALGVRLAGRGTTLLERVRRVRRPAMKPSSLPPNWRFGGPPSRTMHSRPSGPSGSDLVRGFARYANAVDPRHQIPPLGLIVHRYRRQRPHIYSDREIADLIAAARGLSSTTGLRPFTYATLLALLAVTGMRTGEILNLDRDDVDLANGVLTVRVSKFGKSRHIPLHESTSLALGRFAARRDRLCPAPRDPAFFLNESGTRITEWTLRHTFVRLSRQTGLREPAKSNGDGPRLLDMRHSFAVGTLVRWYRDGVDVERHIPRLATWLGHAHVSDTYWYLSATPELMRVAARRLDRIAPRPRP